MKATGPAVVTSTKQLVPVNSQPDALERIKQKVFLEMGGVPKNFHRATVTPVGARSYRVNVWTTEPAGEFGLFASAKMSLSRFVTAE